MPISVHSYLYFAFCYNLCIALSCSPWVFNRMPPLLLCCTKQYLRILGTCCANFVAIASLCKTEGLSESSLITPVFPIKLSRHLIDSLEEYLLAVYSFDFLTSSSTTRLYLGRVPRLTSDNFTCYHIRGSNPGPPHQESRPPIYSRT